MIRIDDSALEDKISKRWLSRADDAKTNNRTARDYVDRGPSWSDIKPVYIGIQAEKCAYCEKPLLKEDLGAADMEHYRPKSSVKAWPTLTIRADRGIDYDIPRRASKNKGYYLLTHNLWNYVASCKKCNSLKSNFFPTKGNLALKADDPRSIDREEPYLIFPLGEVDEDPEQLFSFEGVSPVLVAEGEKRLRAKVTIDFFDLANRQNLVVQRAAVIDHLWFALRLKENAGSGAERQCANESVEAAIDSGTPHANCARAFHKLYHSNREHADEVFQEAHRIHTKSIRERN